MLNDKIYSDIVGQLVRTRYEANLLLTELDLLERSIFKIGDEDFESTIKVGIRAKTAYALSQVLTPVNREEVLKKIRLSIDGLTYLGMTIAFDPSMETINRLSAWINQNLGQGVAIDLVINKSILGGAVIEYKGKIGSFTVLNKVNDYFLNTNVNV